VRSAFTDGRPAIFLVRTGPLYQTFKITTLRRYCSCLSGFVDRTCVRVLPASYLTTQLSLVLPSSRARFVY